MRTKRLKDENDFLTRKLSSSEVQGWFCIENFRSDSQLFKFYTGLPDYETFTAVFDSFGPAVKNLVYHHSKTNSCNILSHEYVERGSKRSLSPENEFFLVLVRMRLGLLEADIACRASLSTAHVSRICITWIDFLHSYFRQLPIWPTRLYIDETMPKSFKATYPSTRVVIDPLYMGAKWNGSKWNRSKTGTDRPCVYTRTAGTVPNGTAIRALLAPLQKWFHLEPFRLAPV